MSVLANEEAVSSHHYNVVFHFYFSFLLYADKKLSFGK